MKSLTSIIMLILVLVMFTRCSKVLDGITPKHAISQSELTDSDLEKIVIGLYSEMESFCFSFYFEGDVKGENYKAGPGFALTDPMLMAPSTGGVLGLWQNSFTTLKQINYLVETYEQSPNKSNATMKNAGGVAYYFRGLLYYNLVTRWGGVPILKARTYDIVPISSETDVWNFIKEDLAKAEALLPESGNSFYVTQSAAHALLAKVSIALKDYPNAILYANKVLNNGSYELATTTQEYADPFTTGSDSKEIIFALINKRSTSHLNFYQKVNDVDPTWDYSPATELYNSLYSDNAEKTGDIRKNAVFGSDATRLLKFSNGIQGVAMDDPLQIPIVIARIADMYLIKAEAQGETAGIETLKTFMETRYVTVNIPAAPTAAQFQDLILDERHREFLGEGERWYDLKRTNRLDLFKSLNGRDYLMYYPIPQNEIDIVGSENYPQNPGY